jgi:hypothetical protein
MGSVLWLRWKKNIYRFVLRKPLGKRKLEKPRCRQDECSKFIVTG